MLNKQVYLFLALIYTIALTAICLVSNDGLPYYGTKYEDKIYHLIAYGILCFMWFKVLSLHKKKQRIIKALLFSIIYGTIIEILQGRLTTTRDASIMDIVANAVGALIVSIFLTLRSKTIVKKL